MTQDITRGFVECIKTYSLLVAGRQQGELIYYKVHDKLVTHSGVLYNVAGSSQNETTVTIHLTLSLV